MTTSRYTVPYTAFGPRVAEIKAELHQAFEEVLESGRYILGPNVAAFETEFARYCGAELGLGIASGTLALHLVFRGAGPARATRLSPSRTRSSPPRPRSH